MAFTGPKLENLQNEDGCFYLEEPSPFRVWEQQFSCTDGFNVGLPPFLEYEPFPLAYRSSMTPNVELNDFEEIAGDLGLWDFQDHPIVPFDHNDFCIANPNPVMKMHENKNEDVCTRMYDPSMQQLTMNYQRELSNSNESKLDFEVRRNVRYKSSSLTLEEIQKYFDVPITRAAKELNVGLTVLKKRCRELNIARWPHRKIKSLQSLIHNVKELGLTNEIEMLEEHKRMVERIPEMELTERTKKLRQACFKANYKKRRSIQQALFS